MQICPGPSAGAEKVGGEPSPGEHVAGEECNRLAHCLAKRTHADECGHTSCSFARSKKSGLRSCAATLAPGAADGVAASGRPAMLRRCCAAGSDSSCACAVARVE